MGLKRGAGDRVDRLRLGYGAFRGAAAIARKSSELRGQIPNSKRGSDGKEHTWVLLELKKEAAARGAVTGS